jgi:ferredoxin-NADP reductase
VTAFTAFLEDVPPVADRSILLAYGARTADLLIYRDVVERCVQRTPPLSVMYFVEDPRDAPGCIPGRVSVESVWGTLRRPLSTAFYISGPPAMLKGIGADLRARNVAPENIRIDAWE